jgi:Fic-DOC domain mobile mystery protein B
MVPANDDTGNTPLSPEEQADLIPNLATQRELNEWERENILEAMKWALSERGVKLRDPLTERYVRELHGRMFNQTWKWAGMYRKSEKNIGVLVHEIRDRLGALIGNGRYWVDNETYGTDEIAVRIHHDLTLIHPFPNGNGRHARLLADVLIVNLGGTRFSWGRRDIVAVGSARKTYLDALRSADGGNLRLLLEFARS